MEGVIAEPRVRPMTAVAFWTVAFALAAAITLAFQWAGHAYQAELGTLWSDAGPHYLNGLMIARFLQGGHFHAPIAFARDFYLHYPKVSIGHWPPAFYILEAAWMLVVSESKAGMLVFSALMTAGLATITGAAAARWYGRPAGLLVALMLVLLVPIRDASLELMLDIPIGLLNMAAALAYVAWMRRPRWQTAALFALLAVASILSKGNGAALALVPPLAVLISRRFGLLRLPSFWLPAPVVAVLCGPWYVIASRMAESGFIYSFGLAYTKLALVHNADALFTWFGPLGIALAAVGFVGSFRPAARLAHAEFRWVMAALLAAVFLFQAIVPVDIDPRYMIPAVAPMLLLAAAGIGDILSLVPRSLVRRPAPWLAVAIVVVAMLPRAATLASIDAKPALGLQQAADTVLSGATPNQLVLLATSNEGAFMVEMADHDPTNHFLVIRGSKLLADSNFDNSAYQPRYRTADEVAQEVDTLGIGSVVLDTSEGSLHWEHNRQLAAAAAARGWRVVARFPHWGSDGQIVHGTPRTDDGETIVYAIDAARDRPINLPAIIAAMRLRNIAGGG